MWQDQHNSFVRYTQGGQIDTGCSPPNNTIDTPCTQTPNVPNVASTPQLSIWASPFAHYQGAIYQPRGAWTALGGSGSYSGPLMIITGALNLSGGPNVTLTGLSNPITVYTKNLVE